MKSKHKQNMENIQTNKQNQHNKHPTSVVAQAASTHRNQRARCHKTYYDVLNGPLLLDPYSNLVGSSFLFSNYYCHARFYPISEIRFSTPD